MSFQNKEISTPHPYVIDHSKNVDYTMTALIEKPD